MDHEETANFAFRGIRVDPDIIHEESYKCLLLELAKDEAMKGTPIEEIECTLRNRGKTASFYLLIDTLRGKTVKYQEKVMRDIWRCGMVEIGMVMDSKQKFRVALKEGASVKELKFVVCPDPNCARCQILILAEGMACGPL